MSARQRWVVGHASEIPPGGRKLVTVKGRRIGIFNVDGEFHGLLNYCPHYGGALCEGPVTGTALPCDDFRYVYGREGEIVRCAWHGWEFDIRTGVSLVDPRMRAKHFPVQVEANGDLVLVM